MADNLNNQTEFRLVIVSGLSVGQSFPLPEGSHLIGRADPQSEARPAIDLEAEDVDSKISRRHAFIERRGSEVIVEDAGSLNGTFVNKTLRLEKGERRVLKIGDLVMIGKVVLRLEG